MAKKLKTQSVKAMSPDDFARIKIDKTQQVLLEQHELNIDDSSNDNLSKMSKKELEYKLNFEETDINTIKKIKSILKNKSK